MRETDWSALWRELSCRFRWPEGVGSPDDRWQRRAHSFGSAIRSGDDPLMELVLNSLGPTTTVLDIGAGTGRWSIPMARVAHRVTAIDPSSSMLAILRQRIAEAGLANIAVLQARWEEIEVEPHDVALCSHAMYASPDFQGFVRKMERGARRRCFLVMRLPSHDGVIGELSQRLYGHRHDSPNFIIGYNILCQEGILANVLMETSLRPWSNDTMDDALHRAKRHLGLSQNPEHDALIRQLLAQCLTFREGKYYWPDGMRSALVWWDKAGSSPLTGEAR